MDVRFRAGSGRWLIKRPAPTAVDRRAAESSANGLVHLPRRVGLGHCVRRRRPAHHPFEDDERDEQHECRDRHRERGMRRERNREYGRRHQPARDEHRSHRRRGELRLRDVERGEERRHAAAERPRARRSAVAGVALDQQAHAARHVHERREQRQVRIGEGHDRSSVVLELLTREPLEVDPPQAGGDTKPGHGDGDDAGTPGRLHGPAAHGHDQLAEHDQREQPEPLRDVRRVHGDVPMQPRVERRHAEVEQDGDGPDHGAPRRRQRGRHEPQRHAERVDAPVPPDQRSRFRRVSIGAHVQRDEDSPERRERDREPGVAPLGDVGDLHREREQREHLREGRDPERQVVGVEAVGVEAEPLPGEEHREEETARERRAVPVRVVDEEVRELRDRDDEHEVEEELEPRGMPLALPLGRRPKARRPEPAPGFGCGGRHARAPPPGLARVRSARMRARCPPSVARAAMKSSR